MEEPTTPARLVKPPLIPSPPHGGIELTPNGLQFSRTPSPPLPMKGGGKRGKVEGFSYASARRLRETLFRANFQPAHMSVVGLCLTLPKEAPIGTGEEVFTMMHRNRGQFPDLVSAVWRKEVQRNGREHYHVVLWCKARTAVEVAIHITRSWCRLVAGRVGVDGVERKMLWTHFRDNDAWMGFLTDSQVAKLMPCTTPIDSQGQGVRYLIDHSSKHKAHQAKTKGRAWGVWNRKGLPLLPPEASVYARLSPREEVEVARILRHLSRYWVRCGCVFGWRWCRGRRFAQGRNIVADAMARDAVRRWLEVRGIIDPLMFDRHRLQPTVQPTLPLE